jgi:hypothetical protein
VGPEVLAGLATRLSSSTEYDEQSIWDLGAGAGFWYESADRYALGARYQFFGLGSGRSRQGVDSIDTRYDAHTLWAAGRLYPYRSPDLSLFVAARVGLVFVRQHASGVRTLDFTEPAGDPFLCSSTSTPNLGFAGGLGLSRDLSRQLALSFELGPSMLRGSSEVVNGCAPGLGSVVTVNANLGLAYFFDT